MGRCDCCKFWIENVYKVDRGNCQRRAPIRIKADIGSTDEDHMIRAQWPVTLDREGCGDFEECNDA